MKKAFTVTKEVEIEKFQIDKGYVSLFNEAISAINRRYGICNDSIFISENGNIDVWPTSALYLFRLGMEYQKLIDKK